MLLPRLVIFVSVLLAAANATAQTTYRWVDKKTGQTVFSDQPPPPDAKQIVTQSRSEQGGERQLPYATQQAAQKFPVTLYTAANCIDECKQARDLLNARGIPFSEKMLSTTEDAAALTKILGAEALIPSITVGQQSVRGLEAGSWNNLLDLAGYPKSAPYGSKPSGGLTQ